MISDLAREELRAYRPERHEQDDFDEFWRWTLEEAAQFDLDARFTPQETALSTVETFDVSFRGYGGHEIRGWLNLPRHRTGPLPCVVEYIGYGGGRGNAQDWLLYSAAGYAHLIMDTRGQGGGWRNGDTIDPAPVGGTHHPGFVTLGVESPETYYYRRVYTDAVRALEAAKVAPDVDASRIVVAGTSQGGGIAIAAAALSDVPIASLPGVPFLCHMERAVQLTESLPYFEITRYLRASPRAVDDTMRVLSYFDGVNLAPRATIPTLFSVALMDQVCPPSTVYAAYNYWAGPKQIREWAFNDHDGAISHHAVEQLAFLRELFTD